MMNFILASTSTVYGSSYLTYLEDEIKVLFKGVKEIVFIPYARPSGLTHQEYTAKTEEFFSKINIGVIGLHEFEDTQKTVAQAQGIFVGGGNTFLLLKQLYEENLMSILKNRIETGVPYLGTSAGSNICGISIKTTNDMPIVYPPTFDALSIVPFNINPHYLDADPNSKHKGETRETRISEFLTQNETSVLGLREGSWIRGKHNSLQLKGSLPAILFTKKEIKEIKVDEKLETYFKNLHKK